MKVEIMLVLGTLIKVVQKEGCNYVTVLWPPMSTKLYVDGGFNGRVPSNTIVAVDKIVLPELFLPLSLIIIKQAVVIVIRNELGRSLIKNLN